MVRRKSKCGGLNACLWCAPGAMQGEYLDSSFAIIETTKNYRPPEKASNRNEVAL